MGWLAWHIGALGHVDPKKFPKLHEVTGEKPPARRRQTPAEMLAAVRAIAAAGAPITITEAG